MIPVTLRSLDIFPVAISYTTRNGQNTQDKGANVDAMS